MLCSLASNVRKPSRALEFVEQVKSRGLLDLLADSALAFPAGLATELAEQVSQLTLTIRFDNIALDRALHDGERSRILSEIRSNRQQLDRLWKTIEGVDPEYVALRRGEPAKWKEIQAVLRPE